MANFWKIVNKAMRTADVLLLVLDARMVDETRNVEIEEKVKQRWKKPLIYVVNKSDLIAKKDAERYKRILHPCVFVSSTKKLGTTKLRERILIEGSKIGIDKRPVMVGVLGYPNVGKSSVINAVKGQKSASTSAMSGHTHSVQKIKADRRVVFLDTPGVIPYQENTFMKHAMIGTQDFTKIKEPDMVVEALMKRFPGKIEKHFGMPKAEDIEQFLEDLAVKKHILKRGNKPDTQRMATMILKDWQKGTIVPK